MCPGWSFCASAVAMLEFSQRYDEPLSAPEIPGVRGLVWLAWGLWLGAFEGPFGRPVVVNHLGGGNGPGRLLASGGCGLSRGGLGGSCAKPLGLASA